MPWLSEINDIRKKWRDNGNTIVLRPRKDISKYSREHNYHFSQTVTRLFYKKMEDIRETEYHNHRVLNF